MQKRVLTLFAILRGRLIEFRWHSNRAVFLRLPMQTIMQARLGTLPVRRLQYLVKLGLNSGVRVPAPGSDSYESLQRAFLAICERIFQTEELKMQRKVRKAVSVSAV